MILSIISISFLCKGTRFSKTSWLRGENIGTLTLDVVTWRHGDITSRFSDFRLQLSELNCLVSAKNGQTSSKDVKTCQRFQIVLFLLSKQLPASSFASWPKTKLTFPGSKMIQVGKFKKRQMCQLVSCCRKAFEG